MMSLTSVCFMVEGWFCRFLFAIFYLGFAICHLQLVEARSFNNKSQITNHKSPRYFKNQSAARLEPTSNAVNEYI